MKKAVKKEWHAPKSPVGRGDFYGRGIKQPVGKSIRSYMDNPVKNVGSPPKSLA